MEKAIFWDIKQLWEKNLNKGHKMKLTARELALQALLKVKENEGYSNIVIDKALREFQLDKRDYSLASAIFYGVLEKRITLDYYLKAVLKSPNKKLDTIVEIILQIAVYQIFFMDRIPESAIVNEAVNCAKINNRMALAGFINGVLRKLVREKNTISLPLSNNIFSLSIKYSVPQELIELWQKSYGQDLTIKILEAFTEKPKLYIRVNNTKTTANDLSKLFADSKINLLPSDYIENSAELINCGSPKDTEEFNQGLFHVQDLSAQLICHFLSPKAGELICDTCAAPGGKSFTIAEMMNNSGKVSAFDLYKGRVKLIRNGAERLGLTNIHSLVNDATEAFDESEKFDKVLCDVPCSGYGVIRRKPEIRYKALSTVRELPDIQYKILENSSHIVKVGGLLVYSTCTLNFDENQKVVNQFLKLNPSFIPYTLKLPNGVVRAFDEPEHMFTMFPFTAQSDGFFVSAFIRKS